MSRNCVSGVSGVSSVQGLWNVGTLAPIERRQVTAFRSRGTLETLETPETLFACARTLQT
ncbi:MAG TPA: hypothetical protein VGE86_08530 [Thermoanaerobaculia bacterium]